MRRVQGGLGAVVLAFGLATSATAQTPDPGGATPELASGA